MTMFFKKIVSAAKKNSWLILFCGVLTSLVFTIWGGCLLLGCLLYVAFSNRMAKARVHALKTLLRDVSSR
jgi:hypothetical protein